MSKPTLKDKARLMQAYAPEGATLPEWTERALGKKQPLKYGKPEEELQIQLCDWMNTQPRILYFSVPNHFFRGKNASIGSFSAYMSKQKRMGLRPGTADLILLFLNKAGVPVTCCIELKAGNNQPTLEQKAFLKAASERGAFVGVVRSLEDLLEILSTAQY